jgi:hypothetical protein
MNYDNPTKARSRREVWGYMLRRERAYRDTQRDRILILDETQGLEVEELLGRGVTLNQVHVCNRSPAVVATLRRKYPSLGGTHGVSAGRACENLAANGDLVRLAYFDFTACASGSLQSECERIGHSGAFTGYAMVAFNILRGREAPTTTAHLDAIGGRSLSMGLRGKSINRFAASERDVARLTMIASAIAGPAVWNIERYSCYKSPNGQTMMWCVISRLWGLQLSVAMAQMGVRPQRVAALCGTAAAAFRLPEKST